MSRHAMQRVRIAPAPVAFDEQFYAQLRKTPWVGLSLVVHGVVLGLFLLIPASPPREAPVVVATAALAPLDEVALDDPPPPDPNEHVDSIDEPESVPENVEIDETFQRDDDLPTAGALGDPEFIASAPFEERSLNSTIGIAGGAGGAFGDRVGGHRNGGGTGGRGRRGRDVEREAVDDALDWLARHQSPTGNWDADGFDAQCRTNRCGGLGEAPYDPGVSGLALLAFLGTGETHTAGPHREVVKRGLGWLRDIQDSEGCIGPRTSGHFQYNHTIATLALAEAYGLTGSKLLREPAQRAIGFVQTSQNPYLAWRYGVRDGDNDTSVTGWAVMALKSAKMAGLEVDGGAFRGALAWVDKMTEPELGRVGYQRRGGAPARTNEMLERFPAENSESMTAVGVLTRVFCGQDPAQEPLIGRGTELLARRTPRWDVDAGTIDMYYWYYGTLAMFQVGGESWKTWNQAMRGAIVDTQRKDRALDEHGSWDPLGPWGPEGGRVYSTATMALCLEVYYRYERVFGR